MENKEIKGYKEASELCEKVLKSRNKYNLYKEGLRPIANLKHMLETSVELFPDNVAFWQKFKKGEPYTPITFRQTLEDVNALGTALISRGLKNKKIGVIGENSYFWAISYLAVACGVGVVVPLDKELSAGELEQLVEQSGISCVLMSSKYKLTFKSMLDRKVGNLEFLVDTGAESSNDRVYAYRELISEGKNLLSLGDRAYLDAEIDPEALGVLLFTSGTTGVSKGVMLSHRNLCSEIMLAPLLIKYTQDDIFFSVLPLHHTYECTCGFLVSIYRGSSIGYCEGLKYIQKNLQELKPTIFCGVPLIFDNLHNAIMKNVRKQGKEALVTRIMKVGRFTERFGIGLPKALLGKIRDVFGGRMRLLVSGGAAIRPEIMRFFNDLGFIMIQGYGLTECAPLAAAIPTEKKYYNYDSVGRVMEQVEVKIIDKDEEGVGEICLKGPNVMMGYYNNPEETEKSLIDGWFHTGDLGYIDKQKYIYITGRKKNIIISSSGKNVFPEEIEEYLENIPQIAEVVVVGRENAETKDIEIVAIVYPDEEECKKANLEGDAIYEHINGEITKINKKLAAYKHINKLEIREEPFEKTTTRKIRRNLVK